jgi:threonyl-tRNA synthetase
MKLLLWHCKYLRYVDGDASKRPRQSTQFVEPPRAEEFDDVVLALTCVEKGDTDASIRSAASSITEMAGRVKRDRVVVVPFAHLTSADALEDRKEEARPVVDKLVAAAAAAGSLTVTSSSFGYNKEFELHFVAHDHFGSVCYREFDEAGAGGGPGDGL